jgi:uncharacterized membrane protein YfcA
VEYYLATISIFAALIFALGGVGAAIILIPIMDAFGVPISVTKPQLAKETFKKFTKKQSLFLTLKITHHGNKIIRFYWRWKNY